MSRVRCLIVEDEPLARRTLRELIEDADWLELVGEAADGRTAVSLLDELQPALVFLDVQLPELSGLEVLAAAHHQPAVVFTTAFDRYAVAAFEVGAIDYLVKPFGRRRFGEMLRRAEERLAAGEPVAAAAERARMALDDGPLPRLFARKGRRVLPIPVVDIVRIQARGDYVRVHTRDQSFLLHLSLSDLESRLDPLRFQRIHRSHLVNLDHVREMRPLDERRFLVCLADGSEVAASRTGSQRLRELIH